MGLAAQLAPALGQRHDKAHALGVGLVLHHIRLGQIAAVRQALEADRPRDDAAIDLGHRHMHGNIARLQAVGAVQPGLLVAARQDQLQHGDIACQRMVAGGIERGLRERGGVEDQCDLFAGAQRLQGRQAPGVLQRLQGQRQRVHALGKQRLAQVGKHLGVARLQMRLVEQQHDHWRAGLPLQRARLLPGGDRGLIAAGVVNGHRRQGARRQRRMRAAQQAVPDKTKQLARIGQAAFAQVAPQGTAVLLWHRAFLQQVQILAAVAREHGQRNLVGAAQRHDALGAIGPVALAAQVVDDDELGMLQHLIGIQIDRCGLAQVHQIGQPHAGQLLAIHAGPQLLIGLSEQGQGGVCSAQDHDVGRALAQAGDKGLVVDKATGLDREQMHQSAPTGLAASWARMAASSRSWPIKTRWLARFSSARHGRSK